MNLIEQAEAFARKAHAGQKRKGGDDFCIHLEGVVRNISLFIPEDHLWHETAVCVAWLHDTVEDTAVTAENINSLFGLDISNAVLLVTRKENQTYKEFIDGIYNSDNVIALVVKLSDLSHNISSSVLFDGDENVKKELDSLREKRWLPAYNLLWKKFEALSERSVV